MSAPSTATTAASLANKLFDVIVIGGSYAGIAAATQLARARRQVLVVDGGLRRNRFAEHSHGFLTQDGSKAGDIAATGRAQLFAYKNVSWLDDPAMAAASTADAVGADASSAAVAASTRFAVTLASGAVVTAKKIILATGVRDAVPAVPGLWASWGKHVFACPYCHAYELNEAPIGVLAVHAGSVHQALMLPDWGPTTLFTSLKLTAGASTGGVADSDGTEGEAATAAGGGAAAEATETMTLTLDSEQLRMLAARGVTVDSTPVVRVTGSHLELADGRTSAMGGLFIAPTVTLQSDLAVQLGCEIVEGMQGPMVKTEMGATSVPGVFACGDLARQPHNVTLAVADAVLAGVTVHRSLIFAGI